MLINKNNNTCIMATAYCNRHRNVILGIDVLLNEKDIENNTWFTKNSEFKAWKTKKLNCVKL